MIRNPYACEPDECFINDKWSKLRSKQSIYLQMCDEIVESQKEVVVCMNQPASEFFV